MGLATPNAVVTLMGWNQIVYVDDLVLRVTDYEIGSRQNPDAPDYITGMQDRTAFTKGPVEIEGTINYPLTVETGGGTFNGLQMFQKGSELARDVSDTFTIRSTAGEIISGCKVQTTSLSCNSGEPIQCSSTIWGISEDTSNVSSDLPARVESSDLGVPAGEDVDGLLTTVQIPMWDAVQVDGAPVGMLVTGFSLQIENQLQRNYTMGNDSVASPWGLNATSISAGQRRVTGTVTWQSNDTGFIKSIIGSGIRNLVITITTAAATTVFTMTQCLWNAVPPRLATGDRVTVETGFTALGIGATDFDGLTIS